jgi:hypothetical protein
LKSLTCIEKIAKQSKRFPGVWRCNTCVSTDRWSRNIPTWVPWNPIISGWWFGTRILIFHILGIILPFDFHIFQSCRHTTNQDMFLESQCCSHLHRVKLQLDTQHIWTNEQTRKRLQPLRLSSCDWGKFFAGNGRKMGWDLPSDKPTVCYGKSPILKGQSTISHHFQ